MKKEQSLKEWLNEERRYNRACYISSRLRGILADMTRLEEKKPEGMRDDKRIENLKNERKILAQEGVNISPNDNETIEKMLSYGKRLEREEARYSLEKEAAAKRNAAILSERVDHER